MNKPHIASLLKIMQEVHEQEFGVEEDERPDLSLRTDYSGRAMYGKRCVGLDGDLDSIQKFLKEVHTAIIDMVVDANDVSDDDEEGLQNAHKVRHEAYDMIALLTDFRWDSMGRGMIYYWPRFEVKEEEQAQEQVEQDEDEE